MVKKDVVKIFKRFSIVERNLTVLERIAQRYNKTQVYRAFRKFHTNARTLNNNGADYNQGLYMLHKIFVRVFRRQFTSNAKVIFLKTIIDVKKEYIVHKKLEKLHETMNEKRAKQLKKNTFRAFKEHIRRFTSARQAIRRYMEARHDRFVAKKFFVWHSIIKQQAYIFVW